MYRLKDKRTLVTGGASGIGLESTRQFLNEGAGVALIGSNPETPGTCLPSQMRTVP